MSSKQWWEWLDEDIGHLSKINREYVKHQTLPTIQTSHINYLMWFGLGFPIFLVGVMLENIICPFEAAQIIKLFQTPTICCDLSRFKLF